jgi:hypothetical protein
MSSERRRGSPWQETGLPVVLVMILFMLLLVVGLSCTTVYLLRHSPASTSCSGS